jgi:hypothetical protein
MVCGWRIFVRELDTEHTYLDIDPRFVYGELHFSPLNKILLSLPDPATGLHISLAAVRRLYRTTSLPLTRSSPAGIFCEQLSKPGCSCTLLHISSVTRVSFVIPEPTALKQHGGSEWRSNVSTTNNMPECFLIYPLGGRRCIFGFRYTIGIRFPHNSHPHAMLIRQEDGSSLACTLTPDTPSAS